MVPAVLRRHWTTECFVNGTLYTFHIQASARLRSIPILFFHCCDVFINRRQTIQPVTAQVFFRPVSDIGRINSASSFSEIRPCRSSTAVSDQSLLVCG